MAPFPFSPFHQMDPPQFTSEVYANPAAVAAAAQFLPGAGAVHHEDPNGVSLVVVFHFGPVPPVYLSPLAAKLDQVWDCGPYRSSAESQTQACSSNKLLCCFV
jgi:hypothetical protein